MRRKRNPHGLRLRKVQRGGNWVWGVYWPRFSGAAPTHCVGTSWTFQGACSIAISWGAFIDRVDAFEQPHIIQNSTPSQWTRMT